MGNEKASTQTENSADINTEQQTLLVSFSMTVGMYSWYVQILISLLFTEGQRNPSLGVFECFVYMQSCTDFGTNGN